MRNKFFFLVLAGSFLFTSCGNDETVYKCTSCVDFPEALPIHDSSGKGIYKGIVLGSSGTIKIEVANADDEIKGTLTLDGEAFELAPDNDNNTYDQGFAGYMRGSRFVANDIIIWFEVNASGTLYGAECITFPGHDPPDISIIKEFSDGLVEVFEGTFSGDESGNFNQLIIRDEEGNGVWYGVSLHIEAQIGYFQGEITNQSVHGYGGSIEITGSIEEDNIMGEWDDSTIQGTWRGKRTL